MDETLKGKIAYALLKEKMQREPIGLDPNGFKRELGNMAKKTGFSREELREFAHTVLSELVEEMFTPREAQPENS